MANELMTARKMLVPIMFLLDISSCNPKKDVNIIRRLIPRIVLLFNAVLSGMIVIRIIENQNRLNDYIGFVMSSQILVKTIQLHFGRKHLAKIIDVFSDKFWRSDKIPEYCEKYDRWNRFIFMSYITYGIILFFCIFYYFLNPLFLPNKSFPIEFWFFGLNQIYESPYFEIIYLLQFLTAGVGCLVFLLPLDMLFIAFIGSCTIQFEMLRQKLQNISKDVDEHSENESFERLKEASEHHNLILQFLEDIQVYFTRVLLKQYFDAVSCMGIFIYLQQDSFQFEYAFPLITNTLQTLFYSHCGQCNQHFQTCLKGLLPSLAVSDAAYESGWENLRDKRVKQGVLLVIQRAQRVVRITAGGVFNLSYETFVEMLKAAFSFLTVLRSTNKN